MTDVISPDVSNPRNSCLECDAPLSAVSLFGLCPKCLLELGLHEPAPSSADRIGHFLLIRGINADWSEAWDEALGRRVWVRLCAEQAPAISEKRRAISRTSRLRWISGRRSPSESWDAYEAPESFDVVMSRHPWRRVREWLLALVHEVRLAFSEGTLPADVSLEHLRVNKSGGLVLLDEALSPDPGPRWDLGSVSGLQGILTALCSQSLQSERLPLHAREFLRRVESRRFEEYIILEGNLLWLSKQKTSFWREAFFRRYWCLYL
jgi:hypothetical protein